MVLGMAKKFKFISFSTNYWGGCAVLMSKFWMQLRVCGFNDEEFGSKEN